MTSNSMQGLLALHKMIKDSSQDIESSQRFFLYPKTIKMETGNEQTLFQK